jgi:hypothetical protein
MFSSTVASSSQVTMVPESTDNSFIALCNPRSPRGEGALIRHVPAYLDEDDIPICLVSCELSWPDPVPNFSSPFPVQVVPAGTESSIKIVGPAC